MTSKHPSAISKYKYIWLPAILGCYAIFMTAYFGSDLLRQGHALRFWATAAAETVVLVLLVVFLRKRSRIS